MKNCIIIGSTPLHFFDAIIIAKQFRNYQYHLFFIDQNEEKNDYFLALQEWRSNPFTSCHIFVTDKSNVFNKIKSKRASIKKIIDKAIKINPAKIIVGNDRKNEISALISKIKNNITIEYMDDGLHSYIPEKSSMFKYTFIDNMLKSIIYNTRIYTPKYIGSSDYIKTIYLFQPKDRHQFLIDKEVYPLNTQYLQTKEVQELILLISNRLKINLKQDLNHVDSIIFLPHPKALDDQKLNMLQKKLQNKTNIAIKLHPRDNKHGDTFNQSKIINKKISAEILFLSIDTKIKIFGFNSTSLLMAAWLRPDLQIYSIKFNDNHLNDLDILMHKNNIQTVNINEIQF